MKSKTFTDLTLEERLWLIKEFGSQLMSIEYYDFRILLFEFAGEYVEVYQRIETRQIHEICIATYADLDKYISRIIIGSLKKLKK